MIDIGELKCDANDGYVQKNTIESSLLMKFVVIET